VIARLTTLAALAALAACDGDGDVCAGAAPEPGVVCTVAGSGQRSFNGDGLGAVETDLYLPSAARISPAGQLIIADSSNQRVRALAPDGSIETVAGNGVHDPPTPGSPAIDSPLEHPVDLAFDAGGRLILVSLHDPRILAVGDDGTIDRLAGYGEYGDAGDGGPALEAMFFEPTGIAISGDGTIFIADGLGSRVRAIDPSGTMMAIAGTGEYGYSGDGGPAIEATLDYPTALALDSKGRLLIADSVNHAVRRVHADGTIDTFAGTGDKGFSGDGGPATAAELDSPEGLAVAPDGAVYISDTRNHRIRRVAPDGTIETVAGTGDSAWLGDGGPAIEASFFSPARLSLHGDLLYVADSNNARIRVIGLP
jgi:sugar lactone lactonase YvrE